MAFLSLCIKHSPYHRRPASMFLVSSPFSSFTISAPPPLPFSSKLQPLLRLVASEQAASAFPPGCIAKSIPLRARGGETKVWGGGRSWGKPRVRGWDGRVGDVAEARAVFEKGEPRHISLQTNNFWIFISCFSLPACVPISKANATLTTILHLSFPILS